MVLGETQRAQNANSADLYGLQTWRAEIELCLPYPHYGRNPANSINAERSAKKKVYKRLYNTLLIQGFSLSATVWPKFQWQV